MKEGVHIAARLDLSSAVTTVLEDTGMMVFLKSIGIRPIMATATTFMTGAAQKVAGHPEMKTGRDENHAKVTRLPLALVDAMTHNISEMKDRFHSFGADHDGLVNCIQYHDGRILSIEFMDDSRIDIVISSSDNLERTRCVLGGVARFAANEIFEGNIVSDIYLWNLSSAPEYAISDLLKRVFADNLEQLIRGNRSDYMLFVIYCSYGAEIIALLDETPKFIAEI